MGERLLDEHEIGPAGAVHIAAGVLEGEAAIGVGAQRRLGAERVAQRKRGRDLGLHRLGADLELEETEPFGPLGMRLGDILLGGRIAEQPHRRDLPAQRAADEIGERQTRCAAGEVEQCHLDRRMGAGIAEQGALELAAQRRTHPGVLADEQGRKMIAHGGDEAAERVAGHGRRRSRLAPADGAVRGFDPHQQVQGAAHGRARHGHRLLERQAHRDGVDAADDQGRALADPSWCIGACFHGASHRLPRTRGMWMNSQGDGIGPTGTSIKVGTSRRLNARLSAARSSCGLRARSASAPKLCA